MLLLLLLLPGWSCQ